MKNLHHGDSNPDPPNQLQAKGHVSIHWTAPISNFNFALKGYTFLLNGDCQFSSMTFSAGVWPEHLRWSLLPLLPLQRSVPWIYLQKALVSPRRKTHLSPYIGVIHSINLVVTFHCFQSLAVDFVRMPTAVCFVYFVVLLLFFSYIHVMSILLWIIWINVTWTSQNIELHHLITISRWNRKLVQAF